MLKRLRMDSEASEAGSSVMDVDESPSLSKGKSRATTVEDEDETGDQSNEGDFAPGGDADYFAEEDEEGRFFGGGLTKEQKDILNIFDRAGGEEAREDVSAYREIMALHSLLSLER